MTVGDLRKMIEGWPDDLELEWAADGKVLDLGSVDIIGYSDDGPEELLSHVDMNADYDRLKDHTRDERIGDWFGQNRWP